MDGNLVPSDKVTLYVKKGENIPNPNYLLATANATNLHSDENLGSQRRQNSYSNGSTPYPV